MKDKVLIIGIDGGTWKILAPAIEQGHMPFLKALRQKGSSGILKSTIPPVTPAAWTAFQTGRNAGKTSVFSFCAWDIENRKELISNAANFKRTLWQIVSENGGKVGVLNVPMTYPPQPVNGWVVTGFLTPSIESDFTYPRDLKKKLLDALPDYDIFNRSRMKNMKLGGLNVFVEQMVQSLESRSSAAEFLIKHDCPDLLMVHFQASDAIQHRYWGYLEEGQPQFDREKKSYILTRFYNALDRNIEKIVSAFTKATGTEPTIFVVSDHGFQLNKKRFNLAKWLQQNGYRRFDARYWWLTFAKDLIAWLDIFNLRKKLARKTIMQSAKVLTTDAPVSWTRSKALSMGFGSTGLIYLLEQDEAMRQRTAQQLIAELEKITDPNTGTRVIEKIYHKEELYCGQFMNLMPDLILVPTGGYSLINYYKATGGLFREVKSGDDFQIGYHDPNGIFIASGPGIRQLDNLECEIFDVASTILHFFTLPVDEDMDGRVVSEIFTQELQRRKPQYKSTRASSGDQGAQNKDLYSEQDKEKLQQRLKDLGYI